MVQIGLDLIERVAVTFNAVLMTVLTAGLFYLYYRFNKEQQKQTEILKNQERLRQNHLDILRGQNRPDIELEIDDIDGDYFVLDVINHGSGPCNEIDISTNIFLFETELSNNKNIDQYSMTPNPLKKGQVLEETNNKNKVVDLEDVKFNDIKTNGWYLNKVRPSKETTDILKIRSSEKKTGYCKPSADFFDEHGEYHQDGITHFLQSLNDADVERVVIQFEYEFQDLANYSYRDFLVCIEAKTKNFENFEELYDSGSWNSIPSEIQLVRRNDRRLGEKINPD